MSIEILCAVVSAAVALVAIIAPIVTTIINNIHNSRIQAREFAATAKLKLYGEFLDTVNSALLNDGFTKPEIIDLKIIFSKVSLVCNKDTLKHLENFRSSILNAEVPAKFNKDKNFKRAFNSLSDALRTELKDLQ